MRTYQWHKCEDCPALVYKRKRPDKPTLCPDCAITRARNSALQMSAKTGPAWDRWLASNGPRGGPPRTRQGK